MFGLTAGLMFGLTVGLTVGLTGALSALILRTENSSPTDTASAPGANWRADRTLILLRTLVFGLVFGIVFGLVSGFVFGVAVGLVFGLTAGLRVGSHHAWIMYVIATRRLALSGYLPRRLMAFLDDAHRLGLLRAVGPVYQFRHADLQDHLAATYAPAATRTAHVSADAAAGEKCWQLIGKANFHCARNADTLIETFQG